MMTKEQARGKLSSKGRSMRSMDIEQRLWRSYAAAPRVRKAPEGDLGAARSQRRRLQQRQGSMPGLTSTEIELQAQPLGLGPSMNLSESRLPVVEQRVPELSGKTYVVRMVEVFPFATRKGENAADGFTGFAADLLQDMSFDLNATFEYAEPSSAGHFLQVAINDVSLGLADVLVGPVGLVEMQESDLLMTNSFLNTGLVLLGRMSIPAQASSIQVESLYSWAMPFDPRLWVTTLAMIISYGVVMRLLEPSPDAPEEGGAHGIWQSVWISFLTFSGQLVGHVPTTTVGRFLNLTAAFAAVILTSSYTANIVPILTSLQTAAISISSLQEASISRLPICVAEDSTSEHYVENAFPQIPVIKVAGATTEEEMTNSFLMLQNGTCEGLVMDEFIASAHLANSSDFCNITQVGTVFAKTTYVMGVRYVDPATSSEEADALIDFVDAAAHFFTKITEDGNMTRLVSEHLTNDGTQCSESNSSTKINTMEVLGPLLLFAAAALACFIQAAYRHLAAKKSQ